MTLESNGDKRMQDPPFAVQVELVEGCSFHCDFCGIRGIRERAGGYKFMSLATAHRLAIQLQQWKARIEFAMHGEPTMHPKLDKVLREFRFLSNSKMILTNGTGLRRWPINELLELVNCVAIDDYAPQYLGRRLADAYLGPHPVYWYPKHDMSPHQRHDGQYVIIVQDIREGAGTHVLNTHCGAAFPPKCINSPCAKPFRELSIRWDGSVAICCNDWRGEYSIGHITNGLHTLWNSERFEAARKYLIRGDRRFTPCNKCDARSYRVGLLPDHKGLETLPKPDEKDDAIIAAATSEPLLTRKVERPWEITLNS